MIVVNDDDLVMQGNLGIIFRIIVVIVVVVVVFFFFFLWNIRCYILLHSLLAGF